MLLSRRSLVPAAALVCASLAQAGAIHAQPKSKPSKEVCIANAEEGQTLRDGGKLRDARARFVDCANASCPGAIARECSTWLTDVESRIPTVILHAVDANGADLPDVKVTLDGKPFLERLSGTQMPIDPGSHRLRFEYTRDGSTAQVEENVIIFERQKGRAIQTKLATVNAAKSEPAPAPAVKPVEPAPPQKASTPVAAYVLGGVGIAALGTAAFFGIKGFGDYNDLKDGCGKTHTCAKSDTDSVQSTLLISDIALGVGVVSLGVATYLYLTRAKATTGEDRASKASLLNHAVLTPTRGGGWLAGYETRF